MDLVRSLSSRSTGSFGRYLGDRLGDGRRDPVDATVVSSFDVSEQLGLGLSTSTSTASTTGTGTGMPSSSSAAASAFVPAGTASTEQQRRRAAGEPSSSRNSSWKGRTGKASRKMQMPSIRRKTSDNKDKDNNCNDRSKPYIFPTSAVEDDDNNDDDGDGDYDGGGSGSVDGTVCCEVSYEVSLTPSPKKARRYTKEHAKKHAKSDMFASGSSSNNNNNKSMEDTEAPPPPSLSMSLSSSGRTRSSFTASSTTVHSALLSALQITYVRSTGDDGGGEDDGSSSSSSSCGDSTDSDDDDTDDDDTDDDDDDDITIGSSRDGSRSEHDSDYNDNGCDDDKDELYTTSHLKNRLLHGNNGTSNVTGTATNNNNGTTGGTTTTNNGNNCYRILRELGKGTFGRVVEAYQVDETKYLEMVGLGHWRGTLRAKKRGVYAIKIIRNVERYRRDAEIEADLLRRINGTGDGRGRDLFPVVHDEFDLVGEPQYAGTKCLVMEKLGMSLYDVIKKNDGEGFAIRYVREISIQLFDALDHLHAVMGIVHTDLKPENILLVSNNADANDVRIKIVDFGSAVFEKDDDHTIIDSIVGGGLGGSSKKIKTSIVNTRQYRAPEILLRTGWSYPSDVWAAGCTIAELALGYQLFPAKNSAEHLAMIERRMGKFPRRLLIRGKGSSSPIASRCFHRMTAKHKMGEILKEDSLDYVENECKKLKEEMGEEAVASGLYEMLSLVLTIDPWFRPKAKKALALAKNISDVDDD